MKITNPGPDASLCRFRKNLLALFLLVVYFNLISSPSSLSVSPSTGCPPFFSIVCFVACVDLVCLNLQKILWDTTVIEVEVLQQILKHAKTVEFAKEAGASATNLKKLVVMKLKAEGYEASLCKTSWVSTFDCSKGIYIFSINPFSNNVKWSKK